MDQSNLENEFTPVGKIASGFFEASTDVYAANELRHQVYNHLITILEAQDVRSVVDSQPVFSDSDRAYLQSIGKNEFEIDRIEAAYLNQFSGMAQFIETRYVPPALYSHLGKEGDDQDYIFRNRIVQVPGSILNALVCEKLCRVFGRSTLMQIPGFVERGADVRIDLDAWLARRGLLVPLIRSGRIVALQVHRRPGDTRPFILKSRVEDYSHG